MTGIRYFTPHPQAHTVRKGETWWWPGWDGAYYAAHLEGDARTSGVETHHYRDGEAYEVENHEYSLLIFQLPARRWEAAVAELYDKPHRETRDAKYEDRVLADMPLTELNTMGISILDDICSPRRLVWRQTPDDEKALRQLLASEHYRRENRWHGTRSRPYRNQKTRTRSHCRYRRRWNRSLGAAIQQARGFKLPTPHPHWTPDIRATAAERARW